MDKLLNEIIDGGRKATFGEAEELWKRWPACIVPAVSALKSGELTPEEEAVLRNRIALALGDRGAVARVLGEDGDKFDNFYPDPRRQTPTTENAIDDFIGKFAASPTPVAYGEPSVDDNLPYDFSSQPERVGEEVSEEIEENNVAPEVEELEISEANAVRMVKKGNYEAALSIIQSLSLNNPEKSIYFADQIRFLRKLIINDNNKK